MRVIFGVSSCSFMYLFTYLFVYFSISSVFHPSIHLFIHLFSQSSIHLLVIYIFSHSFIHSLYIQFHSKPIPLPNYPVKDRQTPKKSWQPPRPHLQQCQETLGRIIVGRIFEGRIMMYPDVLLGMIDVL